MADALPHSMQVATYIRRAIKAGVSIRVIFDDIQRYPSAPRSYATFYKIYRGDIAQARAELGLEIGETIMEKALADKDGKMLELVARSKLGWSPSQTVVDADPEDVSEETGAIDDLIALLGLKEKGDTKEE